GAPSGGPRGQGAGGASGAPRPEPLDGGPVYDLVAVDVLAAIAEARDEGAVLAAAPLPDRVRERSARASAIQRIVGQPEGEAAEGRITGAGVVLAHVPQRSPTGGGLDRPEQCGELRDGQLAHQRRRGLDVDHDPLTREQGPSRFRDRGGEPGRLLLWGV